MKKNLAIVLGATNNMAFAAANVIIGIKKYTRGLDADFVIFNDGFLAQDKNAFNALGCELITYEFPLKDNKNFNEASMKQFTSMMYSRYECFNMLDKYKNIVWIDIDTVVQDDIAKILTECNGSMGLWRSNEKMGINFTGPVSGIDISEKCYNSGVIVFKDTLKNYNLMTKWCYDKTQELADILYCPDQGVINLLIKEFNIDATDLNEKFNCHPTNKNAKNAVILHSYRPEKFWNFWKNEEWLENHKIWLQKGGTSPKIKTAPLLSRITKAKWSDSPDPLRKPRQFLVYLFSKTINCNQFNKLFLLIFIAGILLISLFNVAIDPFYIFKTPLVKGINYKKPEMKMQERLTKILDFKLDKTQYDTIFVGSSRVDYSIDPDYYNKITGKTAKNMAIVGPDIVEIIDYTQNILKIHPEIKTIVVGLDFFGFKKYKRDEFKYNKRPEITPTEIGTVLISLSSFNASLNTLDVNLNNKIAKNYNTNGIYVKENTPNIRLAFNKMLEAYINGDGYYKNYKIDEDKIQKLKEFKEFCDKNNINLILIINPVHITQIQAIKTSGALAEFEKWKEELVKIIPVYDFKYVNSVNTESIKDNMENFFESCHYTLKVGNKILDKIFTSKGNYGVLITSENVKEHNLNFENDLKEWDNQNQKLVKEIEAMKKD